jgi:hypothetical protein
MQSAALQHFKRTQVKESLFLVMALVFAVFTTVTAWAQELSYDYNGGLGKLNIRSQSPAQSLRLNMPLPVPGDIKPGWGTRIGLTWSNVWASGTTYLLDYEMFGTILSLDYGFNERLGLELSFENRHYFGGAMDGLIQEFHDLFGIDQNGRDEVPKNRKVIQRFDPNTGSTLSETSANELDNNGLSLLINYNLTPGTEIWPSVNVFGIVRYALTCADICADNHPVDFGLGTGLAKRWSKHWYSYAALGYTLYESRKSRAPAPGVEPIEFEDSAISGLFALSWHWTPNFSLVGQYLYSGPDIKNIAEMNKASHEVDFGFKWKTSVGLLEFAVIENIINFDNSADFGLHCGWSHIF